MTGRRKQNSETKTAMKVSMKSTAVSTLRLVTKREIRRRADIINQQNIMIIMARKEAQRRDLITVMMVDISMKMERMNIIRIRRSMERRVARSTRRSGDQRNRKEEKIIKHSLSHFLA
jgi:hypothetical protein